MARSAVPGAFGRRQNFGSARQSARGRPAHAAANKFHLRDLRHFPETLAVADQIRELALQWSAPTMTGHAVQARIGDHLRAMSEGEVMQSLRGGQIVELNDGPEHNDCRMLVRDENGVCVLYSVKLNRVLTCWWNDPADNHRTLDMGGYQRVRTGDSASAATECLQRLLDRGHSAVQTR